MAKPFDARSTVGHYIGTLQTIGAREPYGEVPNCPILPRPFVVLVVEDECLTRMVAAACLVDAGCTVLEAEHAAAALMHLHAGAGNIRALFTDVQIPGEMDGIMLAHETKRRWPRIGLLIASAHPVHRLLPMPVGSRFLPKPYEMPHVLRHLRELSGA
jgi:two-component system, response regulator PdtaR